MRNLPRRRAGFRLAAVALLACAFSASACSRRPVSQASFTFPKARRPAALPPQAWSEGFDAIDRQRWQEVEVDRKSEYSVVELDGRRCLRVRSRDTASILVARVDIDPNVDKWLSWEWRVDKLVEGEALATKRGSDAPARLYVYFESRGLPWQKRNLDYVWSANLPAGTVLESAFRSSSQIIVVDSGAEHVGQWRRVERNLLDDYRRCFGGNVPRIVAIGVMNDADNTGGEALAYFDDLRIGREPLRPSGGPRLPDEMIFTEDN